MPSQYHSKLVRLKGRSTTAALCPKCRKGHSGGVGRLFPHKQSMMIHNKYLVQPEMIALECPCCGYSEAMYITPINYRKNTAENIFDNIIPRYIRAGRLARRRSKGTKPVDPATGVPLPQRRTI